MIYRKVWISPKFGFVLKVYNHIILEKEDAATAVNEALNFWDKIETLGQKWDINNQ